MKTSRLTRLLTVIAAILSMLHMQLAVASYVCPGMTGGGPGHGVALPAVVVAMPDCHGMDAAQPSLCHFYGHGDPSRQSLDKTPAPGVPPFIPSALVLHLPLRDVGATPAVLSSPAAALTRTTAPPIAIRHCCFRI